MAAIPATYDQDSFRVRNDDGTDETDATWAAAVNTNWSQVVDVTFRVRFLIQETGGGNTDTGFKLQKKKNDGAWADVTTVSSDVIAVNSAVAGFVNGNDTTQQIGAGTFQTDNNGVCEDGTVADAAEDEANKEWEHEYSLQIVDADTNSGDTILLRVVEGDGTVLGTYTNTPSITVSAAATSPSTLPMTGAG